MTTAHNLTVLMADPGFLGTIPSGPGVSVFSPKTATPSIACQSDRDFFVVATASELGPASAFIHEANAIGRLRAVFVRADVDCTWFLPMLERANVRARRNMLVHNSPAVPERVLRAWQLGAQHQLIADAAVVDGRLMVRSCALERFEVEFDAIPALREIPEADRASFDVDVDGSYIHWAAGDIHLGLDMIRYALDPAFRTHADLRRLSSSRGLGSAIRALRVRSGLRQSDIPELSSKQVSRIEAGRGVPRVGTIRKLAAAHGLDANSYLNQIAAELGRSRVVPTAD